MLDALEGPAAVVDPSGRVVAVNDAFESWAGRSRARLQGQMLLDLERIDGPATPVAAVLRDRRPARRVDRTCTWTAREVVSGADGVVWGVLVRGTPSPADPGMDMAVLAAGLAHEIRNPLAALRGAAELWRADSGASEYFDVIMREIGRVDARVRQLLQVSRPLRLNVSSIDWAPWADVLGARTRMLVGTRTGVDVLVQADPSLPPSPADPDALGDAVFNLLKNAVEALPPAGGRVELSVGIDLGRRRRMAEGGRPGPLVRLAVADTGEGIDPDLPGLFTPFFTTKGSGTGLGLILARRTIEAHGGSLILLRRPTGGTVAEVLLPLGRTA